MTDIWKTVSNCNGEIRIWPHSVRGWCGIASLTENNELDKLQDDLEDRYNYEIPEKYIEQTNDAVYTKYNNNPSGVMIALQSKLEALMEADRAYVVSYAEYCKSGMPNIVPPPTPFKPGQLQKSLAIINTINAAVSTIRRIQSSDFSKSPDLNKDNAEGKAINFTVNGGENTSDDVQKLMDLVNNRIRDEGGSQT